MITCTLLDILGRLINEHSDSYPISRLCTEDPISVSRNFRQIFMTCSTQPYLKESVLGVVEHVFWKKEFQMRGAPHYHVLLWIEEAPVIGISDPKQVRSCMVQERVTCRIPDAGLNPELLALVTKYQMHNCTNYCKRRQRLKSAYNGLKV